MANFLQVVAWLEGDAVAAEAGHRRQVSEYERLGDRVYLAGALGSWAKSLGLIGDADAALRAVERGRSLARDDDVADQIELDSAEALARALRNERERALELLERAGAAAEQVTMVLLSENTSYTEAHARLALGDTEGARSLLARLGDAAEARGSLRFADRYRSDLAAIDG
jgi:hypothetical protein